MIQNAERKPLGLSSLFIHLPAFKLSLTENPAILFQKDKYHLYMVVTSAVYHISAIFGLDHGWPNFLNLRAKYGKLQALESRTI